MLKQTFIEKILGAETGSIVFRKPDVVLIHDSIAGIRMTSKKTAGTQFNDLTPLMLAFDHNAPPVNANLASEHQRNYTFFTHCNARGEASSSHSTKNSTADVFNELRKSNSFNQNLEQGYTQLNTKTFKITPLPNKFAKIISRKGLVNWIKEVA